MEWLKGEADEYETDITDKKELLIRDAMGFESNQEYNEIMFLREITHSVNALNDIADIIRICSKKSETAAQRLANFLSEKSDLV